MIYMVSHSLMREKVCIDPELPFEEKVRLHTNVSKVFSRIGIIIWIEMP